jgi:hypothetical protein
MVQEWAAVVNLPSLDKAEKQNCNWLMWENNMIRKELPSKDKSTYLKKNFSPFWTNIMQEERTVQKNIEVLLKAWLNHRVK